MVEKPAVKDRWDWSSSCTVYVQCCGRGGMSVCRSGHGASFDP